MKSKNYQLLHLCHQWEILLIEAGMEQLQSVPPKERRQTRCSQCIKTKSLLHEVRHIWNHQWTGASNSFCLDLIVSFKQVFCLLVALQRMWNPNSPSWNQTHTLCIASSVLTTGPPQKSREILVSEKSRCRRKQRRTSGRPKRQSGESEPQRGEATVGSVIGQGWLCRSDQAILTSFCGWEGTEGFSAEE